MLRRLGATRPWRVGFGTVPLIAVALAAGCGGEADVGTADYSQKFDQPAVAQSPSKEQPKSRYEPSPRERRAQSKGD